MLTIELVVEWSVGEFGLQVVLGSKPTLCTFILFFTISTLLSFAFAVMAEVVKFVIDAHEIVILHV